MGDGDRNQWKWLPLCFSFRTITQVGTQHITQILITPIVITITPRNYDTMNGEDIVASVNNANPLAIAH